MLSSPLPSGGSIGRELCAAMGAGTGAGVGGPTGLRDVVSCGWIMPDSASATSSSRARAAGIGASSRIASRRRVPSSAPMKSSSAGSSLISCSRSMGSAASMMKRPA